MAFQKHPPHKQMFIKVCLGRNWIFCVFLYFTFQMFFQGQNTGVIYLNRLYFSSLYHFDKCCIYYNH